MDGATIEVNGLRKRFGPAQALDGASPLMSHEMDHATRSESRHNLTRRHHRKSTEPFLR
jgi:hypothetical protein